MIKILTKKSVDFLSRELGLPATGREQDWDIELSDSARLDEFLFFYKEKTLDDEQRFAMMALIISSFEDLVGEKEKNHDSWKTISKILAENFEFFSPLFDYWCVDDEPDSNDVYKVTKLMRSVRDKIKTG